MGIWGHWSRLFIIRTGDCMRIFRVLTVLLPALLSVLSAQNLYCAPSLSAVSPSADVNVGDVVITITGSGFQSGAIVKLTKEGESPKTASSVSFVSDTALTATFSLAGASAGYWTLNVANPDGQTAELAKGFVVIGAELAITSPGFSPIIDIYRGEETDTVYVAHKWQLEVFRYDESGGRIGAFEAVWPSLDISVSANGRFHQLTGYTEAIFLHDLAGGFLGVHFMDQQQVAIGTDLAGNIYTVSSSYYSPVTLRKMGADGSLKWQVGTFPGGSFSSPQDIAVDKTGEVVYVSDYNSKIFAFSSGGEYLNSFGNDGINYTYVCSDSANGRVFAYAPKLNKVHVFDRSGKFQFEFGKTGTQQGYFSDYYGTGYLTAISCDSKGNLYTADGRTAMVQRFSVPSSDGTPPDTVIDLEVAERTSTSVQLSWTAVGDDSNVGTPEYYDIRYALSDMSSAIEAAAPNIYPTSIPAGQPESYEVTGLQPDTFYFFTLKAYDESGNASANWAIFASTKTVDEIPPGEIVGMRAIQAPVDGAVELEWAAPGDNGQEGIATAYRILYSDTVPDDTDAFLASAIEYPNSLVPQTAGTMEQFTLEGLSRGQLYYVALLALDEEGNLGPLSPVVSVAAGTDAIPPTTVTDLEAVPGSSPNEVDLMCEFPSDEGGSGVAGFDLRYSLSPIVTESDFASAERSDGKIVSVSSKSVLATISGLSAPGQYYFSIKSIDGAGNYSLISNVPSVALSSVEDSTPPSLPVVRAESAESYLYDRIAVSWVVSDAESGVSENFYSIGTSSVPRPAGNGLMPPAPSGLFVSRGRSAVLGDRIYDITPHPETHPASGPGQDPIPSLSFMVSADIDRSSGKVSNLRKILAPQPSGFQDSEYWYLPPTWEDGDCYGYITGGFSVATSSDALYVTGGGLYPYNGGCGGAVNFVYYAKPDADGNIAQWFSGTPLPLKASGHASLVHNGRLYVFIAGGEQTEFGGVVVPYLRVFLADIEPVTGALGQWRETSEVPSKTTPAWSPAYSLPSVAVHKGRFYVTCEDHLYSAKVNNVAGELEPWESQPLPFDTDSYPSMTLSEVSELVSYDGRFYASGMSPEANYLYYTARPDEAGLVPDSGSGAWVSLGTAATGGFLTHNTRLYAGDTVSQLDLGGGDVSSFISAGSASSATHTGIQPAPGETLYVFVKSRNSQGLWSDTGISDGILVKHDDIPPELRISNPVNGGKIATGAGAEALALDERAGKVFAGGQEIRIFDLASGSPMGSVPVTSKVLGVDRELGQLYAVSEYIPPGYSRKVTGLFGINSEDGSVLWQQELPGNHLLAEPPALAVNENAGLVYISNGDSIVVFDPGTLLYVHSIGVKAEDLYYVSSSKRLYVVTPDSRLLGFGTETAYSTEFELALPGSPDLAGLVVDEAGKRAYLATKAPGKVIVVDLARSKVVDSVSAGSDGLGRSLVLSQDSERLYAAGSEAGLYVFNTKKNYLAGVLGFGAVSPELRALAFGAADRKFYSCDPVTGKISVFEDRVAPFYAGLDQISVGFSASDINSPLQVSAQFRKHAGASSSSIPASDRDVLELEPGFYSLRVEATDPLGNTDTLESGIFEVVQDNTAPALTLAPPLDAYSAGISGSPSAAVQDTSGNFLLIAKAGRPEIEVLDAGDNYRFYRNISVESPVVNLILDAQARKLYVLHSGGVSVVDADTHTRLGHLAFGADLKAIAQSSGALFAADYSGRAVYVLEKNQSAPYLRVTGSASTNDLPVSPEHDRWALPTRLVYDPSADRVLMGGDLVPEICSLDYRTLQFTCYGELYGDIALDTVLNKFYLLNWYRKKLYAYDAGSFALLAETDLAGESPDWGGARLLASPYSHKLYIAKEDTLRIVDGDTGARLQTLTFPRGISSLSFGQPDKVMLAHQGEGQITAFSEFRHPVFLERFESSLMDDSDLNPSLVESVLTDLESGTDIPLAAGGIVPSPAALDSGFYTYRAVTTDRGGNMAPTLTGPFQFSLNPTSFIPDTRPPRTSLVFEGPHVSSSSVIVSSWTVLGFSTEDDRTEVGDNAGDGVIVTRHSLDFGALASGKRTVPAGGFHTFTYFSLDREHNAEAPRTELLFVDDGAPISFITYPPPAEVLSGSSITITGVSYDFETETSRIEISTDSGQTYGYAKVVSTGADGGVRWEYPFDLPAEYAPLLLVARAVDIVENVEQTPDIVPVYVLNKLVPQFMAEAFPRVGQPGDEVFLRVKVLDQFSSPIPGASVKFSATTGILQPEGSTPANFRPSVTLTDEFGVAETTFTIPGKYLSDPELADISKEYERQAISDLKTHIDDPIGRAWLGLPERPPESVYGIVSMEQVVNRIGDWLAGSGLVYDQGVYNQIMTNVAEKAQELMNGAKADMTVWVTRLAEMRRGVVILSAITFGEANSFAVGVSTANLNILSIPHAYDPTGFPTKDDSLSPNFITLGNRSSALTKEEMWGAVPGADELIAYSKARRQINYTNPLTHQQDFWNVGKTLRGIGKGLTKTWKSFTTYPMNFGMNLAVMSTPFGASFLAVGDWAFKQLGGTGLDGMGLPISNGFTLDLRSMVTTGLLPSVMMPPTGLNLGLNLNFSGGAAKVGGTAGLGLGGAGSGLSMNYNSLGGFSLDGYMSALKVNAGQNDWYAGVDLLGIEAFRKIGSSAMNYGLNAINLTFVQGDWHGAAQFGVKDIQTDWNAAKLMKSLDWSVQTPRFDMGKFGNLFNGVSGGITGVPEFFRGIGPNLGDGVLNPGGFSFPQVPNTNSGNGVQQGTVNDFASLQGDVQGICQSIPGVGLPADPDSIPGAGATRDAVFSSYVKQDGQQHGLYAAAGLTKNPVNTASGNLLYWVEDALLPGPPLFVQMVRIYNSLAPRDGPLGYGWSFNYGMSVAESDKGAEVAWGDGGRRLFLRNPDGTFSSPTGTYSKLAKEADGSHTLSHVDGSAHIFSADGKLSAITDRNDNRLSLVYLQGCLSSITDAAGRVVSFECDGAGHITRMTDFAGRSVTYQYDENGNLVKAASSDGYSADYSYGPAHELLAYNDPGSRTGFSSGRIEYDDFNRVTAEFDPAGNRIAAFSYEFTGDSMIASVIDADGNVARDTYDADGSWKGRRNPDGREVGLSFDRSANLVRIADSVAATEMTYDALNRLQNVTSAGNPVISYVYDGDSARVAEERLPDGTAVAYSYDSKGNVTSISERGTDPGRPAMSIEYDAKGNPVRFTDPLGNATVAAYDAAGNRISVTDPSGGVRTYAYTASGKLASTTDENGKTTSFSWSPRYFLSAIEYPDNGTYSFSYDAAGRVLGETNERGETVSYSYNQRGEPVLVTDPDGSISELTYNLGGYMTGVKDQAGNVSSFSYDPMGRMTGYTDPEGGSFSVSYDGRGRATSYTDGEGKTISVAYDHRDRPVRMRDPLNGDTAIEYNASGRIASVTDPRGGVTGYTYDSRGLPVSITGPAGGVHALAYDAAGNMTSAVLPDGTAMNYVYDRNNKLTAVTDPAGQGNALVSFGLDAAGRVNSVTDADGNRTSLDLNWDGRPVTITAPDGGYAAITYDKLGNPASIRDANGNVTTFEYDAFSHMTRRTDPAGNSTSYDFDPVGRPVKITFPDGSAYAMEYDKAGRMSKYTDPEGNSRSYRYDRNWNLSLETDSRGNIWNYTYDADGRLSGVSLPTGQSVTYGRDANGNVTSIKDAVGNLYGFEYDAANRLTKAADPDLKTETFLRDAAGRVIEYTDKNGGKLKLSRGKFGVVTSAEDPLGLVTTYQYDKMQRPALIRHPSGRTETYQYDALGRLTSHSNGGLTTSLAFDHFGNLKTLTNPAGKRTAYSYDGLNRLTEAASPAGTERYAYDKLSRLASFTDTAGAVSRYTYDLTGRRLSETDPLGAVRTFEYDADGNRTAVTDALGNSSSYEYDPLGRLTRAVSPSSEATSYEYDSNSKMTASVDPSGAKMEYEYDALGRLAGSKDPPGAVTSYKYDAKGNQTEVTMPGGVTTKSYYDAGDRLVKTVDDLGGETVYTYDADGNIKSVTSPDGKTTGYNYDAAGRLTVITNPDQSRVQYVLDNEGKTTAVIDELERTLTYTYDNAGRVSQTQDALNRAVSYTYDSAGRRLTETDAAGHVTRYDYDAASRVTAVTDPLNNRTTREYDQNGALRRSVDPLGRATAYEYDDSGRLLRVTDALGGVTAYVYDSAGRKIRETYPDGRSMSFVYDSSGRLESKSDAAGGTTRYEYDAAGRRSSETDPNGNKTSYAYDTGGRLVTVTDAEGGVWNYTYTAGGLLASIRDARSNTTSFSYDQRGRLASVSDPLGNVTGFEHDAAGRRTAMTKPTGEVMEYSYDAGDRLTLIKSGPAQTFYTWSPDDLLLTAGTSLAWEYDALHRLTRTTYKDIGKSVQFAYDAAGNRTRLTRDDLNAIDYEYDALNRLSAVTDTSLNKRYTFSYDPMGRPVSRVYPNGVASSYSYDPGGRLAKLEHRKGDGALLGSFAYAYDAAGNRVSMTDNLGERLYSYDKLNRLTKAAYASGRTQEFAYDPVGNRTKLTEEWPEILAKINKVDGVTANGKTVKTVNYAYDAADRLLTAGNKAYTHDAAGRLTGISDNTGETLFDYDMFDRPWRITYPQAVNPQLSVYQYAPMTPDLRFAPSPLGMRTGKRDSGGFNFHMLDDGGNLLAEVDGGGIIKKRYIHAGLDTPLFMLDENNQRYYYLPDGQGSTAMLTDKYGDPAQVYDYEAYGKPSVTAPDKNAIQYTGREYDTDAKLQYNRARYYDPELGRWTTPDPLAYAVNTDYYSQANLTLPLNLNRCAYGRCNPTTFSDPMGLVVVGYTGFMGASAPNPNLGIYQIVHKLPGKIPGRIGYAEWDKVASAVGFINNELSEDNNQPIILFGHSYGGTTAMGTVGALCGRNIDLLITIDPIRHGNLTNAKDTSSMQVSDNVLEAINYHQAEDTSSLRLFGFGFGGLQGYTLTGRNVKNHPVKGLGPDAHTVIDNAPVVQQSVIDAIVRVVNSKH